MDTPVTHFELRTLQEEQRIHFDEIKDLIKQLSARQLAQNGKVSTHEALLAVHEERFSGIKAVTGRLTTAVTSMSVALFSWILYRFFHGGV